MTLVIPQWAVSLCASISVARLHFLHSKVNILSLSQQIGSRVETTLTQRPAAIM